MSSLLLRGLLSSLRLLALGADTDEATVGAGLAERDVRRRLTLSSGDGAGGLGDHAGGDGEGGKGGAGGRGVDGSTLGARKRDE